MSAAIMLNHETPITSYYYSTSAYSCASSDTFLCGEFMDVIFAQIQADPSISQEERNLVRQINKNPSMVIEIEPIVDQLIAGANEGHPYAYFYHFLKSICRFYESGSGIAQTYERFDMAIASLDKSIRLNPEFKESYLMRAYAKVIKSDFMDLDPAIEDFIAAARLGCKEAIEILDSMQISWN